MICKQFDDQISDHALWHFEVLTIKTWVPWVVKAGILSSPKEKLERHEQIFNNIGT